MATFNNATNSNTSVEASVQHPRLSDLASYNSEGNNVGYGVII